MTLLDLYYLLKPAVPRVLRLRFRAHIASRERLRTADVWPINEGATQHPDWWRGWPSYKEFAFVLTHDIEGRKGMERCRQLAALEMKLGFRSSFNFVPEGEYETSASLRSHLAGNGFEVGVHDLHHDGFLYRSRQGFSAAAMSINRYLEEWQAVGFRSAFMFHNLEWLGDLNVLYDASTFDTDPFEPQSDGANTIFPFPVTRPDGSSYIELPYTLAQDSTLFLILGEQNTDIWKRKLDCVAKHGGMALMNVHPDYISFDNKPSRTEFSVELYEEFLSYVAERFGDTAWFALPRDVAQFVKDSVEPTAASKRRTALAEQGQ